jgi:DNA-binding IclR family transcriptional regulator
MAAPSEGHQALDVTLAVGDVAGVARTGFGRVLLSVSYTARDQPRNYAIPLRQAQLASEKRRTLTLDPEFRRVTREGYNTEVSVVSLGVMCLIVASSD